MWTSRFQHFFHLGERMIYNSAFQELLCGLQIEVVHCPLTAPVICKSSKKGRMALRQILVWSVCDTFLNVSNLKFNITTFLCVSICFTENNKHKKNIALWPMITLYFVAFEFKQSLTASVLLCKKNYSRAFQTQIVFSWYLRVTV